MIRLKIHCNTCNITYTRGFLTLFSGFSCPVCEEKWKILQSINDSIGFKIRKTSTILKEKELVEGELKKENCQWDDGFYVGYVSALKWFMGENEGIEEYDDDEEEGSDG